MKTPIQELIEIMKQRINDDDAIPFMYNEKILELAESMLEKEKEVMKSCIMMGLEFIPVDPNKYNEDADEIYNETFNTKEK